MTLKERYARRLSLSSVAAALDNLKIDKKLILIYLVSFLLPMVLITVTLTAGLYTRLVAKEFAQAETNVSRLESRINDIFNKAVDLSDRLYVNDAIHQIVLKTYDDTLSIYRDYLRVGFIDDYLRSYPEIASVRLYVKNPTMLDNSFFVRETEAIGGADWYRRAVRLDGKLFWAWRADDVSGDPCLSLLRLVRRPKTDNYIGILSINLEGDRIDRILAEEPYDTYVALDGAVVFGKGGGEPGTVEALIPGELRTAGGSRLIENVRIGSSPAAVFVKSFIPKSGLYDYFQIVGAVPMSEMMTETIDLTVRTGMLIALAFALSTAFISFFSRYFWHRVNLVRDEILKVVQNDFTLSGIGGSDEIAEIHRALGETVSNIKTLINEVYRRNVERERLLSRQKDIQFKMLASQINPHFLYNTLETVRMKALENGDREVATTVKLLAKILRHNLGATERPVSLVSELEAVGSYLDIQHIRFGERVTYDIDCTCNVTKYTILPLLIQPIVENSFIHGLEDTVTGGFIYVWIGIDGGSLRIVVRDNGKGMPAERLAELKGALSAARRETVPGGAERAELAGESHGGSSIGLVNIDERIKLYYGERWGLDVDCPEPGGTIVTVKLPIPTQEDNDVAIGDS